MKKIKADAGNFFEDFKISHVFSCPIPRTLTVGDISQYIAFTGERTPRFCDARYEIHPLLLFHLVLGQTVRSISLNARANLGYAGLLWVRPTFAGDTIHTQAEVVGLKENKSKQDGIVYVKTRAFNQKEQVVMEYTRWVMVKKRDAREETPYLEKPQLPELLQEVDVGHLTLAKEAVPHKTLTGSACYWEDYVKGERINHVDGQTVNHADHMAFTRLFQNSAKIHFDTVLTQGKPLVFGGFPMSIGYAQSFNGFQNRLGICAINSGNHANPVYAGDTLYSFTEVLDGKKIDGNPQVGALRLRLVVVKNQPIEDASRFAIKIENPEKKGAEIYHPHVVLDLDYWEQIATGA